MRNTHWPLSTLLSLLFAVTPFCMLANAQSGRTQDNKPLADNDTTRRQLAQFDQFLDSHREIAEQLRKDPSLVNNREFVENHPALQTFLQEQPGIREEIRENPNAFMRQEDRFDRTEDRRDNDTTRRQLAQFDQFLDSHREIAEQLRKDPSLVNNREFVENHPALQTFLQEQPGIREEIRENPNAFMRQEDRFDRTEDRRDNDTARRQLAQFDRFMDSHHEIAEQLRKDPSLVNNREFVENHPALQTFLQEQPGIREEIRENPNVFMRQEDRFDRTEDRRDNDTTRRQLAQFDQFLDSHREIAEQLRKDPSLVNNREFVENHPALQTFLQEQPGIREEIRENPNAFMRQEDRFDRTEDRRDNDSTRRQLAQFDRFMDSHHEIAEQLRKDPSLVNNREFVQNHPPLQTFLQEQPGIREEIRENPNVFMRQEDRFDRTEDRRDRDATHEQRVENFKTFLGGHSNIAEQVSKNPSLARNHEYVESHAEFKEYLEAHPGAQDELRKNPDSFVNEAQQFASNSSGSKNASPATQTPTPTHDAKPKQ